MSTPLVSVVIPCYRQAHFLPMALESVFAQTYPTVEAVVVNDGSDDNTDAVACGYEGRIRYVSQTNAGLPAARNAGIAAASGEYLLFLDADDALHPHGVAALVAAVAGRDDVLAACGWQTFTTDPSQPTSALNLPQTGDLLPRLIHNNIAPPNVFLSPRRLVDRVGQFARELRSCEDWDLWLRLGFTGAGFVVAPQIGAYYRQSPGSMSTNGARMVAARVDVLRRAHAYLLTDRPALEKWGTDLAAAALRVRRRLRLMELHPAREPELTGVLDDLAGRGFHPPASWKEAALRRLLGRDRADWLTLAYFRRFDRPRVDYYRRGIG